MKKRNIEDTILFNHDDLDQIKNEKIEIESDLIYSGKGKGSFVVFITGPDKGNAIPLNKEKIIIGRDSSSDIVIDKKYVSKKHAKIIITDSIAEIIDFGSTNGTYLNEVQIQRAEIKDRDEIRIGDVIFKYFRIDLSDGSMVQPALMDIDKSYTAFYNQVFKELKPYFGHMTDRFLNRQITAHVGKSPYTIVDSDKTDLAKWVRISAGLLLDEETAASLAEKILSLK